MTFHGAEEGIIDTAATSSETPSSTPSTKSQQHQKASSSSSSSSTHHQWAQATELGDFVQEAAKDRKFIIAIKEHNSHDPALVKIRVPSFEERTLFLRRRLVQVTKEMQSLLDIKSECDVSGFGHPK